MRTLGRVTAGLLVLALLWQGVIVVFAPPPYILPAPPMVAHAAWQHGDLLLHHLGVTALEILLGGFIALVLGFALGLALSLRQRLREWLMPALAASQALPVFAVAPILVLWLGYGISSKVAMTVLILFFPVLTAFYDGLMRISPQRIEVALVMAEGGHHPRLRVLLHVIVPSAMPALGSGLRITATLAPVGAVVGEWVGSSAGLGYYILHAAARNQIDQMFAALIVLMTAALVLYTVTDSVMNRLCNWQEG